MAKFCTECGKDIPDGVVFCTACGAAAPTEASAPQPIQQAPPAPQPVQHAAPTPAQAAVYAPGGSDQPPKGRYGVVGTGTYFGLTFLFAIPVIGWLVCVIMAFASKNENKKHFARAMLIWVVIGIVLSAAAYFVFRWLGGRLTDYINAEFGGQAGDLQALFNQLQ